MKQFVVLGLAALLTLAGSGCATRGYARRQAATVNDRLSQVQTQLTTLSAKHDTDVAHANERLATTDSKLQEAASSAAQANASAAQATPVRPAPTPAQRKPIPALRRQNSADYRSIRDQSGRFTDTAGAEYSSSGVR